MARAQARVLTMQMIYERMLGGQGGDDTLLGMLGFNPKDDDENYIQSVLSGVFEHLDELDEQIEKYLVNWTLERLARVDLAILRLAAYEILYRDDIPESVSVNEAVELARTFSTDEAGGFINGVLGSLLRGKNE